MSSLRIACAEADGWDTSILDVCHCGDLVSMHHVGSGHFPVPMLLLCELPDYTGNLNVIHSAVRRRNEVFQIAFAAALSIRAGMLGKWTHQLTAEDWSHAFVHALTAQIVNPQDYMSHPFNTDFDKLSREIMGLAYGAGISMDQSRELVRTKLEEICKDYACRAAGIAGNDVEKIDGLVWYKQDGWGHGGSAISWKERAELANRFFEEAEKNLAEIKRVNVDEFGEARDLRVAAAVDKWENWQEKNWSQELS